MNSIELLPTCEILMAVLHTVVLTTFRIVPFDAIPDALGTVDRANVFNGSQTTRCCRESGAYAHGILSQKFHCKVRILNLRPRSVEDSNIILRKSSEALYNYMIYLCKPNSHK